MSQGGMPWIKMGVTFIGAWAIGWGLLKTVVPTPEQTYQAMAPDLRRKVDENRRLRLEQEKAVRQQLAAQEQGGDADKPLWASPPPGTSR